MSFQELQATVRKCKAVLGKNPKSETHIDLLKKTQDALAKLNGATPKKTKASKKSNMATNNRKADPKPEPEATATVSTTEPARTSASI